MTDRQNQILEMVNNVLQEFNENEKYLIVNDLSERCICSKLASYFDRYLPRSEFSDYSVDVEYNRGNNDNERAIKRLDNKNIVVDIIIHKRGCDTTYGFGNLVCMEMKKEYKHADISGDIERLQKMTDYSYGFNYELGVMLLVRKSRRNRDVGLIIHSKYLL